MQRGRLLCNNYGGARMFIYSLEVVDKMYLLKQMKDYPHTTVLFQILLLFYLEHIVCLKHCHAHVE